jgi:hypothetical protein
MIINTSSNQEYFKNKIIIESTKCVIKLIEDDSIQQVLIYEIPCVNNNNNHIYWTHWRWLLKYKEKQDEQKISKEENNNATDYIIM